MLILCNRCIWGLKFFHFIPVDVLRPATSENSSCKWCCTPDTTLYMNVRSPMMSHIRKINPCENAHRDFYIPLCKGR